ncbi:MAG: 2OG-Fe(II) oxygenase family protein [Pseudomonadota bacterium]
MFENVKAQPVFPTLIWIFDLPAEVRDRINPQMRQDLDRMTAPRPPLKPGTNWQTEGTLHEWPQFAELTALVHKAAQSVLDKMAVEYDDTVITGSWANISPPGVPHPAHIHPNNLLSAVYYLSAPEGGNTIFFHDPRPQIEIMAPHYKNRNQFNSTLQHVEVSDGRLVMFPAWLVHSVPPNNSQSLRMSISFNILPSRFSDKVAAPNWTGLPLKDPGA